MAKLAIDIETRLASFQDGLNRIERDAQGLGRRLDSVFGGTKALLAGLATAVAGVGFTNFVKSSIDSADALQQLSERTGVTVERLSAFQYAAKLSDVSAEGLETGLRQLSKNMLAGSDAFKTLGVEVRNSNGVLRSSDDVLLDLADAFQKLPDGATKAGLAVKVLGKNGTELIPLLNVGRQGIANFTREAERLGVIVSGETARAAADLNDNLDRMRSAMQGIGNSIAAQLVPTFSNLTAEMLRATQAAGSFGEGLVRMVLGQGKDPTREIRETEEAIRRLRKERDELAKQPVTRFSNTETRRQILSDEENELRVKLDFLKRLEEAQRALAEAGKPVRQKDVVVGDTKADQSAKQRLAAEQEIDRIVTEARQRFAAAQFQLTQDSQSRQNEETIRQARATQQTLESILGQTQGGRLAEIERQQGVVNDALIEARINTQQWAEAFQVLDDQRKQVLGRSEHQFKEVTESAKLHFAELEAAIKGWGDEFTNTLAEAVKTGKLDFKSLADSIISDLLRMAIYKTITKPLFGGITSFLGFEKGGAFDSDGKLMKLARGGVFDAAGPVTAFASGGVVTKPTIFPFANGTGLMGEAGPEAIMPLRRGPGGRLGIDAYGSGSGGNVVINVNQTGYFYGGADANTLTHWAEGIKASTIHTITQMARRGQFLTR